MNDYIRKENIKFVIEGIVIVLAILLIGGFFTKGIERDNTKSYDAGYEIGYNEGYQAALDKYGITE